ncbi:MULTISPECIES: hypothetical protein [unclassified Oceanobacter]|uniref:hypothetical protein n=1 Tax=unclassified Oceanobacter TaxID=2620260 RepID=UPI002733CBBA|nr:MULTISPECIES: hypothetical protein [unclassified Oceanobacter]MDP2607565.1 hypothetical protein [Oceanobacter sp. 1_MG-2023]MDP2610833.1 hypothetical protein [Oceanobacter sp. 2_MG-2023]
MVMVLSKVWGRGQQQQLQQLICMVIAGWPLLASAETMHNHEAVIPPQCYTQTEGKFNPCYVCHQSHPQGTRINYMDDGDIQGDYSFSELGETNHWSNLFKPRLAEIANVSDEYILDYVRQDNYSALMATPNAGYTPDLTHLADPRLAFDGQGFARDGSGWVAFNYKPLPSTFWPTNGSFDDVMIRLPPVFRQDTGGNDSRSLYLLNLSLLEMTIKDLDNISIPVTDESLLGLDLDGDNTLGLAVRMQRREQYLGAAATIDLVRQQYPVGTEFIHTVRYLDISRHGDIEPSRRLKELRYSRKYRQLSEVALRYAFNQEHREKAEEKLPHYSWAQPASQAGMNNKLGWQIQGWIENESGDLRLQNYEENAFCMGCHTTTGTHIDSTLAFPRKVTGAAGWGYINLKGMNDVANYGDSLGEIASYFERVGGGDEFRQNGEMIERWFNGDGSVNKAAVATADVYTLLIPSTERALALNKAYQRTVLEQSFYLGRDAVLGDPVNVFATVDQDHVPVLPASRQYHYDLRLQWPDLSPAMVAADISSPDSHRNESAADASQARHDAGAAHGGAWSFAALGVLLTLAAMLRRRIRQVACG